MDHLAGAVDDVADAGDDAADALDDVADTRRDIDQVATALDDVADEGGDAADALDDVASTRRDIDQVATALDDVADESGDAEKAFGDLARGARRDLGRVGDAADTAERDVDDLTDEVGSSAREFGSAFRGDPIEALEEVQSLTSELATRFIPGIGGAVAAVTGGVVFSALIGFYERWKEEQEAINERVRGFRDEVVDALGVLDTSVIKEALVDQLDQAGVSASELETILAAAPEELRVGFRTALQSGDLQGLLDLSEEIDDAAANINQNFVAQGSSLTPGQKAVLDLNKALGGTVGELYDGVTEAQSLGRVLGNDVTDAAEDAEDAIDDASRDRNTTIDVDVAGVCRAADTERAHQLIEKGHSHRLAEHAATRRHSVGRPHTREGATVTTLSLVADPDRSRVQVIVSGLGADAPATVYRTAAGAATLPVRGGVSITGDGVVLDDYEAPLGVVLTYDVHPTRQAQPSPRAQSRSQAPRSARCWCTRQTRRATYP